MNTGIKTRWVQALRSGEYKQGRRQLRSVTPDGEIRYCCLGVLCELAVQDGIIAPADGGYYASEGSVLPPEVTNWAELPMMYGGNPPVRYNDRDISLAELNDGAAHIIRNPLDFSQIADIIEDQL